jgi:hypothetical protein
LDQCQTLCYKHLSQYSDWLLSQDWLLSLGDTAIPNTPKCTPGHVTPSRPLARLLDML